MFGRGVGMGTKIGASLVAALVVASGVTMTGCKCKPDKPVETPEQKAAALMEAANVAFEAAELDKAEEKVNEAKTTFSGVEGAQELLDKIAEQRKVIAAKVATAKIRADAKAAYDAKNYARAIEIASKRPDDAACKQIIADAKMKLKVGDTAAQKAKYTAQNAKVDAAIRAGRFADAISAIRALEPLSGAGIGPSRLPEIRKIQSKDKLAQAKRTRGRRALELAEQAVRLDPQNSEAKTLVARLKKEIAGDKGKAEIRRRYDSNMRRIRSMVKRDPRGALRLIDEARRQARQLGISTRDVDNLNRTARTQSDYQTAFDQAKRYLQRGELARAKSSAQEARRKIYTPDVVRLLKTIEGQLAEKEGDAAVAAGKWDEAVVCFERADANGASVAAKLANAKAKRDEAKLGGRIAFFTAERAAGRFMSIKPELATLAKKYPDNKQIQKLLADGPTSAELKKAEAAAKKFYDAALKKAKAVKPPTAYTRIIGIWEDAMADLVGRYEKSAKKAISSAKDKMMAGKYKQFTIQFKKLKKDDDKITFCQQQIPIFEGTSYKAKIEKTLGSAKTAKAKNAYTAEMNALKKIKPTLFDQRIAAIEGALAKDVFTRTSYEKKLKSMLTGEKTKRAAGASKKVAADIKKLPGPKNADRRIARYEQAIANRVFADTKFLDGFNKSVKKERDAKAKGPFAKFMKSIAKKKPQERIIALTDAVSQPIYSGTSFIDKMNADITKTKEKLLAGKFKTLLAKVKKITTAQLRIVSLEGALPTYAGTKFEKTIKGMVDKENDGILAARYKKLLDEIKKLAKTPLRQIDRLKTAQAEFASSKKYKASVDKLLKSKEAGLEKSIYNAIMGEAKKAKKAADKLRIYERRKGDLKTDVYRKKLDATIKKLNDQITKEAQKAKDAQLKTSYAKLMKKIGAKGMKSADKVTILQTEQAAFAGSSFAKKITDEIAKCKKAIAGEEAKAKEAAAKKVFDAIKLVKAKKPADCDANIAKLEDAKFQVGKTSYAKKIDSLIAKERATKKKLTPKPPKR